MKSYINIYEKHSLILRWLHWLNVPLLLMMIWSGILIYWAHQPYVEIPEGFARNLHIEHRLAEGMGWHFFIMWPFLINGFIYFIYSLFKGKSSHRLKYHKVQRVAYTGVLVMGVGAFITGLAIYKPVQMGFLTSVLGGYELSRLWHFLIMILFILFITVHVIQVLRAGWNNFRAMIAGYELEKE